MWVKKAQMQQNLEKDQTLKNEERIELHRWLTWTGQQTFHFTGKTNL